MQSSDNVAYKCCKNKPFIHYVCEKCHGIYHKACISKFRKQIRFVKQNIINCCVDDLSFNEPDEKSILEKTLSELTEDSEMKNKHIEKLTLNNKLILDEAQKREEELTELLVGHEKTIQELKQIIDELKKTMAKKTKTKTTNSVSTQTTKNINKTVSTSTIPLEDKVNVIVQEHILLNS